jgi:hypothetical protein
MKTLKNTLEEEIKKAVVDFKEKTGIMVKNIQIGWWADGKGGGFTIYRTDIRVK